MIRNLNDYNTKTIIHTELCIVGSGASGITIAREFLNTTVKVLLIESGDLNYSVENQSMYEGENLGHPRVDFDKCRLRYFGGTTNHWGGWSAPYNEIDFETRDWVDYSGWPLKYSELVNFYERATKVCKLDDLVYNKSVTNNIPIEQSILNYRLFKINPLRFSDEYFEELRKSKNIIILFNANLTNIQINGNADHIKHLDISTLSDTHVKVKSNAYVLSCGGIETPRLLLLSNYVMNTGVGNQFDQVGRYFMDHPPMDNPPPVVKCGQLITNNFSKIKETFSIYYYDNLGYLPGFHLNENYQRRNRLLNSYMWFNFNIPDPYVYGFENSHIKNEDVSSYLRNFKSIYYHDLTKQEFSLVDLVCQFEQLANPDNRIILNSDKDALGLNRVSINWNLSEVEKATVLEMTKLVASVLSTLNLGRVRIEEWLLDKSNNWPLDLQGAWHHIGTTRMSENPKTGVVDKNCRVHGIDNLYISGCSVFPTSGYVNPTLTIVALSIRLADYLKSDLIN